MGCSQGILSPGLFAVSQDTVITAKPCDNNIVLVPISVAKL